MTSSKETKKEIPEKEFSDESDYAGKPIDEVIRDAITWETCAFIWRKNYERVKSENERLRKALELAREEMHFYHLNCDPSKNLMGNRFAIVIDQINNLIGEL